VAPKSTVKVTVVSYSTRTVSSSGKTLQVAYIPYHSLTHSVPVSTFRTVFTLDPPHSLGGISFLLSSLFYTFQSVVSRFSTLAPAVLLLSEQPHHSSHPISPSNSNFTRLRTRKDPHELSLLNEIKEGYFAL
jgi:hypothetical protein